MTNDQFAAGIVERFACKQEDSSLYCPRCGKMTLKSKLYRNALSRRAKVHICSDCGLEEAVDDADGIEDPLDEWDIVEKVYAMLTIFASAELEDRR